MAEHPTVNRRVVGSNPTRGVRNVKNTCISKTNVLLLMSREDAMKWLLGQAVKTSPFHGGNTGSIPVGVTRAKAHN